LNTIELLADLNCLLPKSHTYDHFTQTYDGKLLSYAHNCELAKTVPPADACLILKELVEKLKFNEIIKSKDSLLLSRLPNELLGITQIYHKALFN
jgi:hypothetical protein